MDNKITKPANNKKNKGIRIILLFIWGLLHSVHVLASGLGVDFQSEEILVDQEYANFSIGFKVVLEATCAEFRAELSVPESVYSSDISVDESSTSIGELGVELSSDITNIEIDGIPYVIIPLSFNPLKFTSTTFSISGFSFDGDICSRNEMQMYIKYIPSELCTNQNIIENESTLIVDYTVPENKIDLYCYSFKNDNENHPTKLHVRFTSLTVKATVTGGEISIVKSDSLKCIGVTLAYDISRNISFNTNSQKIDFNETGNTVSFNASVGNEYVVYFEQKESEGIETFPIESVTVSANIKGTCDSSPIPITVTNTTIQDFTAFDDNDVVKYPDINMRAFSGSCLNPSGSCVSGSESSYFHAQVDNSFKGTGKEEYDEGLFIYEIHAVDSSFIDIRSINSLYNLYNIQNIDITYQDYDSDMFKSMPSNNQIPETDRAKRIRFQFNSGFPEYSSYPIRINYRLKTVDGVTPIDGPFLCKSYIFYKGDTLKTESIELTKLPDLSCSTIKPSNLTDYYKVNGYFQQNVLLQYDNIYPLRLEYYSYESEVEGFSYKLKTAALLFKGNIRYSFSETFSETNLSPLPEDNYTYDSNTGELVILDLNLVNTVSSNCAIEKKLYIVFDVQINPTATFGTHYNNYYYSYSYSYSRSRYEIPATTSFYLKTYSLCDPEESTYSTNLSVTDQYYTYKYLIENAGSRPLHNILLIGLMPHEGDKWIVKDESRNSSISLACNSISNIRIEKKDALGNSFPISNGNTLPSGWEIEYSTTKNPCLSEYLDLPSADKVDCINFNWTSEVPSEPGYFKIKAKDDYSLSAGDTLIVTMTGLLPEGLQEGEVASNSFAAGVISDNVPSIYAKESETLSTITIAPRSSCFIEPPCTECKSSFAPEPGKKYVLSAWVKEPNSKGDSTYTNSGVKVSYEGAEDTVLFVPQGAIIEGWQRIYGDFVVPQDAYKIKLELKNTGGNMVYFDDIRVYPFNGNMKSYVYDPITLRLVSELDNENYATFYEYDEEGNLIRIKKETERGVMTIRESRQSKPKVSGN